MVLLYSDGAFCGIASIYVWGDELKINVVFGEGFFHFGGAVVVKDVKLQGGGLLD